jgi:hypothetical protein
MPTHAVAIYFQKPSLYITYLKNRASIKLTPLQPYVRF